jgi:hypothetical protein
MRRLRAGWPIQLGDLRPQLIGALVCEVDVGLGSDLVSVLGTVEEPALERRFQ